MVILTDARDTRHAHNSTRTTQQHAATTMNSLYTLGVRQSSSIQADLERLRGGDVSASLLGLSHVVSMRFGSFTLSRFRADIRFTRRDEPHD
jgi:hypothetical protein